MPDTTTHAALSHRSWVPSACEAYIQGIAGDTARRTVDATAAALDALIAENRKIHEVDCFNLNPATNVMNPKAEAAMGAGLGQRPSLGYPGDKYEMGLEAIEKIEVIAAELVAEVFGAKYAEIRVGSGALANLYAFMATCKPGDRIIAPPGTIGGHVTHHGAGAAGLYGLDIHEAPVDAAHYTVDLDRLRDMAKKLQPKLITIGGSLNLLPHPIGEIRKIADEVGAKVLFDAAHMSGMIAGRAWQQPLEEGAHLMTMSTYKSLGGPPGGLIVSNDAELTKRLDAIAYPGLTANFDVGKTAALAITMLDWKVHGRAYAKQMADTAAALAAALEARGLPVFKTADGATTSHQLAIEAARFGGGQAASKKLRPANILACGIGLPIAAVAGDVNGLRLGTPELVRFGMGPADMPELAALIARGLLGNDAPEAIAEDTKRFRRKFTKLH
ncbi:MAG: aminotransferase class I/II-fold pyridoxal phosphate-dependent enzyme, partial [Hyphomicrobiaceae bacterium]